jgi:hypothetical protein
MRRFLYFLSIGFMTVQIEEAGKLILKIAIAPPNQQMSAQAEKIAAWQ